MLAPLLAYFVMGGLLGMRKLVYNNHSQDKRNSKGERIEQYVICIATYIGNLAPLPEVCHSHCSDWICHVFEQVCRSIYFVLALIRCYYIERSNIIMCISFVVGRKCTRLLYYQNRKTKSPKTGLKTGTPNMSCSIINALNWPTFSEDLFANFLSSFVHIFVSFCFVLCLVFFIFALHFSESRSRLEIC